MAGEHRSHQVYYPAVGQEVTVDVTVLLGADGEIERRMVTQAWLPDGTQLPASHFEDLSRLL